MELKSLVHRFLLYTLFLLAICCVGSFFIINRAANHLINTTIQNRFAAASMLIHDSLRSQERIAYNSARAITNNITFRLLFQNRQKQRLEQLLRHYQVQAESDFIRVVDLNQNTLADSTLRPHSSANPSLRISKTAYVRALDNNYNYTLSKIDNETFNIVIIPLRAPNHIGWFLYGFKLTQTLAEQVLREAGAQMSIYSSLQSQGDVTLSTLNPSDVTSLRQILPQVRWANNLAFDLSLSRDNYTTVAQTITGTHENGTTLLLHFPKNQQRAIWWPIILVILGASLAATALGLGLTYLFSSRFVDSIFVIGRNLQLLTKGRQPHFPQGRYQDDRRELVDACVQLVSYMNNLTHSQKKEAEITRERNYSLNSELRMTKRKLFQAELILDVVNATHFMSKPVEIVGLILQKIISSFRFERASVMILNEDTEILELKLVKKWDSESNSIKTITPESKVTLKNDEGIAGLVIESGRAHVAESGHQDQLFKKYDDPTLNESINSIICLPLKKRSTTFGVINISTSKPRGMILKHDMDLLEKIATYASLAISNARLYTASIVDPLTQIYKSRYLVERLKSELQMARRTETLLSILAIEIDNLDVIEKQHGLPLVERLLQGLAELIKETLRKTDIIGRYQNHIFLTVLPHTGKSTSIVVAEKLLRLISDEPIITSIGPIHTKISIGCVTLNEQNTKPDVLIAQSLLALSTARRRGGNQVITADEVETRA